MLPALTGLREPAAAGTLRSEIWGLARVGSQYHDEDFEQVLAMLGGGGETPADSTELSRFGELRRQADTFYLSLVRWMSRSESCFSLVFANFW